MKKLKEDVLNEFNGLIQDVVEAISDAEKDEENKGIDVLAVWGNTSPHFVGLDKAFEEFRERNQGKKKGW